MGSCGLPFIFNRMLKRGLWAVPMCVMHFWKRTWQERWEVQRDAPPNPSWIFLKQLSRQHCSILISLHLSNWAHMQQGGRHQKGAMKVKRETEKVLFLHCTCFHLRFLNSLQIFYAFWLFVLQVNKYSLNQLPTQPYASSQDRPLTPDPGSASLGQVRAPKVCKNAHSPLL